MNFGIKTEQTSSDSGLLN